MNPVKTMSGALTRPVHTAASVTGRAVGLYIGATKAGFRTTGRLVEWVADRGLSAPQGAPSASPYVATPDAEDDIPASATTPASTGDVTVRTGPRATPRSVPTPAAVKPAIDRSAPLEAEPVAPQGPGDRADDAGPVEDDVLTASGIPAAGVGVNPATGQPHSYETEPEPLLDPATVKAVRSETEVLRRAADQRRRAGESRG